MKLIDVIRGLNEEYTEYLTTRYLAGKIADTIGEVSELDFEGIKFSDVSGLSELVNRFPNAKFTNMSSGVQANYEWVLEAHERIQREKKQDE